jgi:hypothetical protein
VLPTWLWDEINQQRNETNPHRDQLTKPFWKRVGDAISAQAMLPYVMAATRGPAHRQNELADVRRCLRPAAAPTLFQSQNARKQYPTGTGWHGVAIGDLDRSSLIIAANPPCPGDGSADAAALPELRTNIIVVIRTN